MVKTKIEWCDSTWNPVTGCLHGCRYCYARAYAKRFGTGWSGIADKDVHDLDEPMRGRRTRKNGKTETVAEPYPYDFQPTLHRYRLDQPKKWAAARKIFVCSMAGLFGEWVPAEWIEEVFRAAEQADQHHYLFLTKNPERYTDKGVRMRTKENWWYGTSVTGDSDAYRIGDMPAYRNQFLSIEPLQEEPHPEKWQELRYIGWIIIGAETGNSKNRITPEREWVDRITGEAERLGIPVFMKDSLIPIIGEENMLREYPWEDSQL